MKRILTACAFLMLCSSNTFGWNAKGHRIIAAIAKKCLDQNVIDSVQLYLGDLSFEDAAVWMETVSKDKKFDYMQPWHYIDIAKDKTYVKNKKVNIVSQLQKTIDLLKTKFAGDSDRKTQMNFNLKVLFHLIGDIRQPLNCGYPEDKGGTLRQVKFMNKQTNLNKVWDSEIIDITGITLEDCLKTAGEMTKFEITDLQHDNAEIWLKESRDLLPAVYTFNNEITQEYIDKNKKIIEKQLVKAGVSLSYVLFQVFRTKNANEIPPQK